MRRLTTLLTLGSVLVFSLNLQGCALTGRPATDNTPDAVLYRPSAAEGENHLLERYAPYFAVQEPQLSYNRIGAAAARPTAGGDYTVYIDTSRPTIYTMVQKFTTAKEDYTNLIYRVHFPEVPWPHLSWGRNPGLLVYVTLNSREEPVLITTVHTCGCYLAMIPTSKLPREQRPAGWLPGAQKIYGEQLPGELDLPAQEPYGQLLVSIRGGTHRVMQVEFRQDRQMTAQLDQPIKLEAMAALDYLALGDRQVSFFEQTGRRRGYVRGNVKPLELLLMSWWALDLEIGEDKALGPLDETGVIFYTSLKFWARQESNLWYFQKFLNYWGWDL